MAGFLDPGDPAWSAARLRARKNGLVIKGLIRGIYQTFMDRRNKPVRLYRGRVMITVVSWNIDGRLQAVEELLAMDADVALLQEVGLGALETLKAAGGNVAVSPQDPWEPWTREH